MTAIIPRLGDLLESRQPPKWLVEVHDHYAQTGEVMTEDLERVLGDQKTGVYLDAEEATQALCRPFTQ
jgi:hypothetical protein